MKTLYIDCGMGAAGDMLTAALLELIQNPDTFIDELNHLGIPGVAFRRETALKCGIQGTHVEVTVNGTEETYGYEHGHEHDHNHGMEHDHDREHEHGYDHNHDREHEHGYDHNHDREHEHGYDHNHDREHEHGYDHNHDREHEHGYDHNHDREHEHGYDHNHDQGHDLDRDNEHIHTHDHVGHHSHRGMQEIEEIVNELRLSDKVKADVLAVYSLIAEAESKAHGVSVSEIHFHEVGAMDAIADITAVCLLMEKLEVKKVVVSPVHVGSGHVHCAHGILPVPAPATASILRNVPIYGGGIRGELCTPTGAALLKYFATSFGEMPVMKTSAIGYGMGNRDFEVANCVRVLLGETADKEDRVLELNCNVDDMTAEDISFAMERLFEAGALEVFTVPVGMKKSRPGVLLFVLCREEDREALVKAIFCHTATIGVREMVCNRYVLSRSVENVETSLGRVSCKHSYGYGVNRCKYEYEDLSRIAREKGMSMAEVRSIVEVRK